MPANVDHKTVHGIAFGAPVPGQSLTTPPKNMPFEHPPQFVDIKQALPFLMDQITEPQNFKQMLTLFKAGIPIEAMVRTLLFTGFAGGKWTVDLALLMYKPLMLSLITLANRAGLKDTPVLMTQAVVQNKQANMKLFMLANQMEKAEDQSQEMPMPTSGAGFMSRS